MSGSPCAFGDTNRQTICRITRANDQFRKLHTQCTHRPTFWRFDYKQRFVHTSHCPTKRLRTYQAINIMLRAKPVLISILLRKRHACMVRHRVIHVVAWSYSSTHIRCQRSKSSVTQCLDKSKTPTEALRNSQCQRSLTMSTSKYVCIKYDVQILIKAMLISTPTCNINTLENRIHLHHT